MTALLTAKGIASELVLINGGNAHTLDLPATLAALNHVMIYLPEFGRYDDPTASFSSFGALSETYDKPAVHLSASGVRLGRTPAMRATDHTLVTECPVLPRRSRRKPGWARCCDPDDGCQMGEVSVSASDI